mmetsp:Transcript_17586/g.43263  ORF Transcript_17586/g.43263 Transcript_17586/m.43263 type:complete len:558 (-) Transcript_17586:1804-3477(-)
MEHIPHDEFNMSHISSQQEGKNKRTQMGKPTHNQTYEILEHPPASSDDNDDAEVDTQDEGFSIVSSGQHSMTIKTTPSMAARSRKFLGTRSIRTPTIFAPRSPKNYRPLRKSRSRSADPPPLQSKSIPPQQSKSNFACDSPKYRSKSDVSKGFHHSMSTDDESFDFPSPFPIHDNDQPVERSIKTSEDEDFEQISDVNFSFHQSLELVDVFPSAFDDAHRPPSSMPEMKSPMPLESSDKSGNGSSRGSSFEQAMAIDPFQDDCVEFSPSQRVLAERDDLLAQIQALRQTHKQEVEELKKEVETSQKIIGSLTKQVQDLMARNEELSRQNKKAKEAEETDRLDEAVKELKKLEKQKSGKRKSNSGKRKSKKVNQTDDIAAAGTSETMVLEDPSSKKSKKRSSKATGTTKKKRKSKRSSKISISSSSLEADEHPLAEAKRRKSLESTSPRRSIIAATSLPEKENKKTTRKSSKTLSDTIENLWAFEWKDPVKLEGKRGSSKKRKHSAKSLAQLKENLEASVGNLPKRKAKRKSSKAKQAKTEPQGAKKTKRSYRILPMA